MKLIMAGAGLCLFLGHFIGKGLAMGSAGPQESTRVLIVLTKDLVSRLASAADRDTSSRSLLIRQACERLLSDREQLRRNREGVDA